MCIVWSWWSQGWTFESRDERSYPRARKLEPKTPSHPFSNEDFERLKSDVGSWNPRLEDGFPCLLRHTWETLYDEYKVKMEQGKHRVMSFTRWLQYVHYFFPEISIFG